MIIIKALSNILKVMVNAFKVMVKVLIKALNWAFKSHLHLVLKFVFTLGAASFF